jgi:hypothetical protein
MTKVITAVFVIIPLTLGLSGGCTGGVESG